MEIQLDPNQDGNIGGLVASSFDPSKKNHFVTPKYNPRGLGRLEGAIAIQEMCAWMGGGCPLPTVPPILFREVSLTASVSADFAKNYKWENATPVHGAPHRATVSRLTPGHFPVRIKNRVTGRVEAELNVWVVWATIKPEDVPFPIRSGSNLIQPLQIDSGGLDRTMAVNFIHEIQPHNIVTGDFPDLRGAPLTAPGPRGALDHMGRSLAGGVNAKWDVSRIIRKKIINPAGLNVTVDPRDAPMNADHPHFPSMADGDGRPGGAEAASLEDWLVVGNDDSTAFREFNNPYDGSGPGLGKLSERDVVTVPLLHNIGANGNTLEWRLHFQEFTRLEINRKWYVISDHFPWRMHFKFKKVAGQWQDSGSEREFNNDGF
jgi:hypothetical protein